MRKDLFIHVVNNLRFGAAQDELSEKINKVVTECRKTGKRGSVTLKINVKPNGDSGQYELLDKIDAVIPEMDKGSTLMFGTPEGNLQRENPSQPDLPLRSIEKPDAELKKVD